MPYQLNHADNTLTPITLTSAVTYPPATGPNNTSLTFYGRSAPFYGQGLQQNLLNLLENWASPAAPVAPLEGQTWFDKTSNNLKIFQEYPNGSGTYTWIEVGNVVKIAYVEEYNQLAALYNVIVGTPVGTTKDTAFGYGQTNTFNATRTSITNQDWKDLFNAYENLINHMGFVPSFPFTHGANNGFMMDSSNSTMAGIATEVTRFEQTVQSCNDTIDHRFDIAAADTISYSPPAAQRTRTTAWSSDLTHELVFTFASANAAKAYFNSGGRLATVASLALPAVPEADETTLNALFSSTGTLSFSVNGTSNTGGVVLGVPASLGFYDLTTTYQTIFQRYVNSAASEGGYKVEVRSESSGTVIRMLVTFVCPTGGFLINGAVTGTLNSNVTMYKPDSTYLNSPAIAYPTLVASGTI